MPRGARDRALGSAPVLVVAISAVLGVTRPWERAPAGPAFADHPDWSVARRWDEAPLDAIRRALPNPPVHARNLFHASVAMWDAWAAYDPMATGYVFTEKPATSDVAAARREAMSYAAYRVLTARFIKAVGADKSLSELADVMDGLCLPLTMTSTDGDAPAAVGNRGQSRLYGGIHIQADDFTGCFVGSTCGKDAWALAQRYYSGLVGR